jgi:hypothetical protein
MIRLSQGASKMTKPLRLAAIGVVLLVVLLLQIMPQMDLQEIAFYNGTAPVLVKSRLVAKLVVPTTTTIIQFHIARNVSESPSKASTSRSAPFVTSLPLFLCCLLC